MITEVVMAVTAIIGIAASAGSLAFSTIHGDKQYAESMAYSKQQANDSIKLAAAQEQRSIDQQRILLAEQNSAEAVAKNVNQQIAISNQANRAYNRDYRNRVYGTPAKRGVRK